MIVCRECNSEYPLNTLKWRCDCGGLFDIRIEPRYKTIVADDTDNSIWRYRKTIPVENDNNIISFGEGHTPLVAYEIGERTLLLKLDYLFPTGSFKDRGASVLLSKTKELGISEIVEDSSGNAGAAIAAYAAKAGIRCKIYIPAYTSRDKALQIAAMGAELIKIDGTRDDVALAAREAAERSYYASHSHNPFFFEGIKTAAFELYEQLGNRAPDTLILPVGNGSLMIGMYIGFRELVELKLIPGLPRLLGIQAANCAPIYEAYNNKTDIIDPYEAKPTIGEGVSVSNPARGKQILEIIRKTSGRLIAVSENEIKAELMELLKRGFFVEPTSAVAIAGARKTLQETLPGSLVVSILTGHGLKSGVKIAEILNIQGV